MTRHTSSTDQPYRGSRALVIGGSIGGLTTALVLRDIGFEVDVYERTATPLHGRGSGIVLQPDTLRWFEERSATDPTDLKTATDRVQYLDRENRLIAQEKRRWEYTSWGTFYQALLDDFGPEHYHLGSYASGFDDDGNEVTVRFADGRVENADLVVFADGINSVARAHFDADAEPTYSGYVGWRGTVPLRDLTRQTRLLMSDAITYSVVPNSHITLYPIPGEEGVAAEDQLMNYVWYRNVPAGPRLTELLTGINGFVGAVSLHPGQVQERFIRELRETAAAMLAPAAAEVVLATIQPYLQVVLDVRSRRMALGRTALVGDAACSARPHAAAGTAKAAADAWALRDALLAADGDIRTALIEWEPGQLELSHALISRVTEMGDRSQFHNTWVPGDPSLRFGLYGPGILYPDDRQPQNAVT
jgi:2,6-dihydroxypyridine 3-monooxygenase